MCYGQFAQWQLHFRLEMRKEGKERPLKLQIPSIELCRDLGVMSESRLGWAWQGLTTSTAAESNFVVKAVRRNVAAHARQELPEARVSSAGRGRKTLKWYAPEAMM